MTQPLRWACIGAGSAANDMAGTLRRKSRPFCAVYSRTFQKAADFAKRHRIARVYETLDELLADDSIDCVYLATPHNTHYAIAKQVLQHGKHVLAEKAITLNSEQLSELCDIARERDRKIAEAMTIWHMPLFGAMHEMITNGESGKVQMITVNFGSFKEYDLTNRFYNMSLAGGALLDLGVYALSMARLFLHEQPQSILSEWKPSPTGSDEKAAVILRNDLDQMASIAISIRSKQPKRAVISCENGYFEVMEYPRADHAVYVDAATGKKRKITAGKMRDALFYEVLSFEQAVQTGDDAPLRLDLSKDVMAIMTRLRRDWGLQYPDE